MYRSRRLPTSSALSETITSPSCSPPRSPGPSGTTPATTTPSSMTCAKTPSQARRGRLLRSHRAQQHGLVAPLDGVGGGQFGGDEPLPVHADERQPDLEILGDELGLDTPPLLERDVDRLAAHDDVVDRQDEARGVDD